MEILATDLFLKEFKKIKDKATKDKLIKKIKRILKNPNVGKPLRYDLKGERTLYVKSYRIIFKKEDDNIIFLRFEHRKEVYK